MRLQHCQLARDFDFSAGPSLGILDVETREVVGTACDASTRDMFVASPDMLAALSALIVGIDDGLLVPRQGYMAAAIADARAAIAKAENI